MGFSGKTPYISLVLILVSILLLGMICLDGLQFMVKWWGRDEYSHGYLIPIVALYLLWQKRVPLSLKADGGSFWGFPVLLFSLFVWGLGEVSALYTMTQYAFVLGVFSIMLLGVGVAGTKVILAPLVYLIFMIPLPNFLYFNLSQELQLISSALGVAVVRFFDISVYLEGNVIDLGSYQLQVVEACSGLRYLFPLMSFGFLISYIYRGPIWQKVVIFLSTIPITVLMNSFRIGVIGVTVEHFGIAAAEGFLHDFEGWVVFMACIGVLLLEIWLFLFFGSRNRPFWDSFDLDFGASSGAVNWSSKAFLKPTAFRSPALLGVLTLLVALPFSWFVADRTNVVPERTSFNQFPLNSKGWSGREQSLDDKVLGVLKLTDYIRADYRHPGHGLPVGLYAAWYAEQRKGASIHSPKSCLPGGGWEIKSHTIVDLDNITFNEHENLRVNRVIMQKGEFRQLVYYWFHGRSRNITNEYLAKWYIFWDSLAMNRTDGALVRLVTIVPENSDVADADARLREFLDVFYERLSDYIPD